MTLVNDLQKQFDGQVNTWADKQSMLKKPGISHATKCNMYCVNHLNEEKNKHTSTRNIGAVLQNAYTALDDKEKLTWVSSMDAPARSKSASLSK
jgi:hypothetical protein